MCDTIPPMPGAETGAALVDSATRFDRQKQRIVDAATALLNDKGMRGMTLSDVATELGLSTTSVTYYFRRKEQLLTAVFEDTLGRLAAMVDAAQAEATPRARVARYVELHFEHFAGTLRQSERPLANLSEIRSMDEPARSSLIEQYRGTLRAIRSFFGPARDASHRDVLIARAHILNEALLWQRTWLGQFAIGDMPNVRQRFFRILDGGIVTPSTAWDVRVFTPGAVTDAGDQESFLRVATRFINATGYRGASVKRIMAEFNRTKGSFYHHLDSKDDLVVACWRASHRRLADLQTRARAEQASAWKRLSATVQSALQLQFADEFPLLRVTAYQAMPPAVRALALRYAQRTALGMMGELVEGMAEGAVRLVDPFIAAQFLLAAINAAYDLQGWRKDRSLAVVMDAYKSVLGNGLFAPE